MTIFYHNPSVEEESITTSSRANVSCSLEGGKMERDKRRGDVLSSWKKGIKRYSIFAHKLTRVEA